MFKRDFQKKVLIDRVACHSCQGSFVFINFEKKFFEKANISQAFYKLRRALSLCQKH